MTTALRTLAFAAATAAILAAGTATAWDDRMAISPPAAHAPAPGWQAPPAQGIPRWSWEARELLREYRQLDWARARFYRRWGSNPWRVARFDAWYGWRRAELDRRWAGLDRRRSEPHHGWPGPEASWHRDRDD